MVAQGKLGFVAASLSLQHGFGCNRCCLQSEDVPALQHSDSGPADECRCAVGVVALPKQLKVVTSWSCAQHRLRCSTANMVDSLARPLAVVFPVHIDLT